MNIIGEIGMPVKRWWRLLHKTAKTGLQVHCELDANSYPKGIVVSDAEMASINIKRADFHGEWNYAIAPSDQLREAIVS